MLSRRISWKLGCAALALLTATQGGRLQADDTASGGTVQASAVNVAFVESMIEDALRNGTVSGEERQLIVNQAQRRLDAAGVAAVEARLASLPAPLISTDDTKKEVAAAPQTALEAALDKGTCCDQAGCGGLFDNYYLFAGIDGWSGPADDDNANNFGARVGFNLGTPLIESRGIGGQFGMSYGAYNFHGRDNGANLARFEGASVEDQIFLTLGAFKRCNMCGDCPDRISWGIVYDHLITDNYGEHSWEFGIGQFRGQIGYALDCCNEVGAMLSLHTNDEERTRSGGDTSPVSALDQGSLYYRHHYCWGADTMLYVGLAEEPGDIVFGMRNEVPLSQRCSLYANAQYILPSTSGGDDASRNMFAEEFWNVSVGFAFYPNCNAVSKSVCGRRWMPLLPVADNGTFAVDIAPDQL